MNKQLIIQPSGFIHTVFFWLKESNNHLNHDAFLAHLHTFINASHFVQSKHIGKKNPSPRDVVDNSYDFCLTVTFDTQQQHDDYQVEPAHLKFIKDAAHLWKNVKVYDSVSVF